jgi:hypothetical protein
VVPDRRRSTCRSWRIPEPMLTYARSDMFEAFPLPGRAHGHKATMAAYDWDVVALDHRFHTHRQMERWTVSQAARVEILDRLLEETISAPRWKPRRSPLVAVARVVDRSRPIRNRSSGERAGKWGAHRRGRSPPGSRRSRLVASRGRSRVRSAARRGGRGTGRRA